MLGGRWVALRRGELPVCEAAAGGRDLRSARRLHPGPLLRFHPTPLPAQQTGRSGMRGLGARRFLPRRRVLRAELQCLHGPAGRWQRLPVERAVPLERLRLRWPVLRQRPGATLRQPLTGAPRNRDSKGSRPGGRRVEARRVCTPKGRRACPRTGYCSGRRTECPHPRRHQRQADQRHRRHSFARCRRSR